VVAYGLLLPKTVLQAFPKGCINIHPSLLPRWRGAAPIHRTVLAGDTKTAICIMQMDEGLDTGDVLMEEHIDVPEGITTGGLHDLLAKQSPDILLKTLDAIDAGKAKPIPQAEEGVTYAQKISKEEALIDWSEPAEAIARKVRGLNPFPIAMTTLNDEAIKIWEAKVIKDTHGERPGEVMDKKLTIACGTGALRPTLVQRPGKKPMSAEAMLRGFEIPIGTKLG
ncbi:MAG: methionyl-tRNA formyltransferase, partial [Rickettsiales bacterium]